MLSQLTSVQQLQTWVIEEVLPSIKKTGQYTLPSVMRSIESVKDVELIALGDDDRKDVRKALVRKANLVKDPEKVEMGRCGGQTNQENIHEIKLKLENKKLKIIISNIKDVVVS